MGLDPISAANLVVTAERAKLAHALGIPNPTTFRLQPEPKVMGVDAGTQAAPTIGAVTTTSSISGGVIEYWNGGGATPNMRVLGPTLAVTASVYGRPTTSVAGYAVEFIHEGTFFEVVFRAAAGASACRVMVDGEWASAGYQGGLAGGVISSGDAYVEYTFADDRPRHIRVYLSADTTADVGDFKGIMRQKTGVIYSPDSVPLGPRLVIVGDSWTFGTGVTFRGDGLPFHLARLLGMNHVAPNGRSGTGYLKTSGQLVKFGDRIATDVTPLSPDIGMFIGSINDNGAFTKSQIQTEASADYAAFKAANPSAKLIVIGPQNAGGAVSQNGIDNRDAVKAAAVASVNVDLFIDSIAANQIAAIDNATGWMRGTGKTSATNGTGNTDRYVASDALHLVAAGYRYWARRAAQAIAAWIAAGMPRASWTGDGPLVLL